MSSPNVRNPTGAERTPVGCVATGKVEVDSAAVAAAADEIFRSHRARALELSAQPTPLGRALARLFERERAMRGGR